VVLITLEPNPHDCRVELDGKDISSRLCRIEVDANVGSGATVVRLTLIDSVTIAGIAGVLEFIQPPRRPA